MRYILCVIATIFVTPIYAVEIPTDGFGSTKYLTDEDTKLNIVWVEEDVWAIGDGLVVAIQNGLNLFLAFMWVIALIVLIIWGIKIMTAGGNEDGYASGWKYVKNAAIGLAIIWFSRFVISAIFRLVGIATGV